jgi:hypothetical protein
MLRSFFTLLELHGAGPLRTRDLACDDPTAEALHGEGILARAPLATKWPCEAIGCARVVVATGDGFVATCTREEDRCETLDLARTDLAQVNLSLEALFDVVRRELRIEASRRAPSDDDAPLYLGEQGLASPRDVFFELRPRSSRLPSFLAAREHAPRPTLLLVPSITSIDPDLVVKHAPGAKVEIDALADALTVRGGRIMAAPRLRKAHVFATAPSTPKGGATASSLIPRPRRWTDLTVLGFDKRSIIARAGRRSQRLTAADLGMACKNTREPKKHFFVLLALCAGNGEFRWKEFGSFESVCKAVSRLRADMCAAFGITEKPFYEFTHQDQWRAKFRAAMASDEDKKREKEAASRAWSEEEEEGEHAEGREVESAWDTAFEDWKDRVPDRDED